METWTGDRVVLRELRREDADVLASWPRFQEPDLQWANFELRTPAERDAWVSYETGDSTRKRWAVTTLDDELVGLVGLRHVDYGDGSAVLGIRLKPTKVNQGYGTDAITTLLRYAFFEVGLRRVDLDVLDTNIRAIRCYEKCGFREIGRTRHIDGCIYISMRATRDSLVGGQRQR